MRKLSHTEQVCALEAELRAVVHRFSQEFDLTIGDAMATLESLKLELYLRRRDERMREIDGE